MNYNRFLLAFFFFFSKSFGGFEQSGLITNLSQESSIVLIAAFNLSIRIKASNASILSFSSAFLALANVSFASLLASCYFWSAGSNS